MESWNKRVRRVLRRAAIGTAVLVAIEVGWHK